MPVYTFTTLDDPSATQGTTAWGINNSGRIVGTYSVGNVEHGFVRLTNGSSTTIDDPNATGGRN
jgi:hypothetical protein